jgi:lipocalin
MQTLMYSNYFHFFATRSAADGLEIWDSCNIMLLGIAVQLLACTPVSVQRDFNLSEYVRASWYVQHQQQTSYLPLNNNYCVAATYNIDYSSDKILVYNNARVGSIAGKLTNPKNRPLCARPKTCFAPAKLRVGTCLLPTFFSGDYWVLAAGPSNEDYDWAIVSGGQPRSRLSSYGECSTNGLWLLSRNPSYNKSQVDEQLTIVEGLGITTRLLNQVQQRGCNYSAFIIK